MNLAGRQLAPAEFAQRITSDTIRCKPVVAPAQSRRELVTLSGPCGTKFVGADALPVRGANMRLREHRRTDFYLGVVAPARRPIQFFT
jgi:hypothetical protein